MEKIVTDTQTHLAVPYTPYADPNTAVEEQIQFDEYNGDYSFTFGYYGNGSGHNLIFDNTNSSFHISNFYNHFGGYTPSEAFFSEEFIYIDPNQMTIHNPFSYDFRYEGGLIYLDITNNVGSVATFYDNFLSQKEFSKKSIFIYPNPSSDYIKFDIKDQTLIQVSVFDMKGKLVLKEKNIPNKEINVSFLNKGVYIIKIETSIGLSQRKLIKN